MRGRTRISCFVLLLAMLPVTACETVREHPRTAIGVGAGAVGGGIIGGLAKGKKGALWGGLVGALAGGAVGAYLDHKEKSAQETKAAYAYEADQGTKVVVTNVSASPATVSPGGDVNLEVTYAVMAPDDERVVQVQETRLVTLAGNKVAEVTKEVSRTSGTYASEVSVNLPSDAPPGAYQFLSTVEASGRSSQRSSSFTVK